MANSQHLDALASDEDTWNEFLKEIKGVPDLSGVNLFDELKKRGKALDKQGGFTFSRSIFLKANFYGANLTYIAFSECDLRSTDLRDTKLDRAGFISCRLEEIKLDGAKGEEFTLEDCNFQTQTISFASFIRSWFSRCDLREASFIATSLQDTIFENCKVNSMNIANFCYEASPNTDECEYSSLEGVSGLTQQEINSINIDRGVILPDGSTHSGL